jgi:glycosyltransferase involved in cell wall biosynthesis
MLNKTTKKNLPISVIIITKNAEHSVEKTLKSVSWANEIIVIDSKSSDNTVKICESYDAIIKKSDFWPGFGPQKNKALGFAKNRWILSIDSDEVVSNELYNEINKIMTINPENTAFYIRRINFFCGERVNYSGWQDDFVLRLFPKKLSAFTESLVHERVIFHGHLNKINAPLLHYSYKDFDDVTDKIHRYSSAGAHDLICSEKKITFTLAILHALWSFFKTYFLKFGFLDGKNGLIIAFMNMETTFYKYLKAINLKNFTTEKKNRKKFR